MVFLTPHWRPRRSALFMPASNARALEKARTLDADVVIFDLEDSVGPGEQESARANLRGQVAGADYGHRERVVRVSAADSPDHAGDVEAAVACGAQAILVPKVEAAGPLAALAGRLEAAGSPAGLWAMIESPRALMALGAIADAHARLACLVVGPNDLARTTGVAMRPGRAAMIPWLMSVVAAARASGLGVLDGVFNNFRDAQGFAAECAQGAELGFDGKTLIHPAQIEAANRAFSPAPEEFARARRVVEAFAGAAGRGAIQIDGEMVERLHLDMARRLLATETRFVTEPK